MATILVIEPDGMLGRTYCGALESQAHKVSLARTAQLAIECVDSQPPDVIVLELQLPAHNGLEFLYELRSYPEWARIPVIINSFLVPRSLALIGPEQRAEIGIVAAFYKPVLSLPDLQRAVRAALNSSKSSKNAAGSVHDRGQAEQGGRA